MFLARGQLDFDSVSAAATCRSAVDVFRFPSVLSPRRNSHGVSRRGGFSLVELLLVIVLASILVNMAFTSATSTIYDQLRSVANIVSGEFAYGRSLAVGNNSSYRFDLDTTNNRLTMRHAGADTTLNTLPASPFRSPSDPVDQAILDLGKLPRMGMPVSLLGAQAISTTTQNITSVEFGPYGATTQANQTVLWLTAGSGTKRRYFSVTVNPVTGLSAPGSFTSVAPSGMTVTTP